MFGKPSKKKLAEMCRRLSTMLEAGVSIRKAFAILKSGRGIDKAVLEDARASVGAGDSAIQAFSLHEEYFPPLFLSLVEVGERTGTLDRVLNHLAEYYEHMHELSRKIISSMVYPAFVITLAILVTALLKYVMTGTFADISGQRVAPDAGKQAAIRHLILWFGGIAALIGLYFFCRIVLRGATLIDRFLLRVPILGKALRSLAVARFTWAFQLSQAAGLGIPETIERSLLSTDNAAFISGTDLVVREVESGSNLRDSLEASELFPADTLEMIEVAETSGKLEESMGRIAKNAFSDAEFALNALAKAFGWFVWVIAAGVAVYYVFWFYSQYFGAISKMMGG